MRLNPRIQKNSLLLAGTAIAGPALVIAGLRYPGSWIAKGFLMATGAAVAGTCYTYLNEDIRGLLSDRG